MKSSLYYTSDLHKNLPSWKVFFPCFLLFFIVVPTLCIAGSVSLNPDSYNFKKVKVLSSHDGFITIQNDGPSKVTIRRISILDQNSFPGEFRFILPPSTPFDFPSGDKRQLQVRFAPQQLGARSAFIEIITDIDTSLGMVLGEGASIESNIHIVPPSIDFGTRLPLDDISAEITVICDGPDSATILSYQTANDNGNLYFEINPLDPLLQFPVYLQPGDSVKFIATFHPKLPVGSFTGRVTIEGIVQGSPICELRGNVAVPDIALIPGLIDFGTIAQNVTVDTQIALVNNGGYKARIQSFVNPNLPYILVNPPPPPFFLDPGDTLWLDVSLNSSQLGLLSATVIASEKTPGLQLTSKITLLQANVVPSVLQMQPSAPLTVLCGVDSTYDLALLKIKDTGSIAIMIDGITSTDKSLIIVNNPFPDSLRPSEEKVVRLQYHYNGSVKQDSQVVVQIIALGRVLAADTIRLLITPARYPVQTAVRASATDLKSAQVIVDLDDRAAIYPLTTLKFLVSISSDGAVDLDLSNLSTIVAGAVITPVALGKGSYEITVTSPSPITTSLDSVLIVGLKYYVTKDTNYSVSVSVINEENAGCLDFQPSTTSYVVPQGCGDKFYRESLNHRIIVNSARLTTNPIRHKNGILECSLTAAATVKTEIVSITGLSLLKTAPVSFKGATEAELLLPTAGLSSGSYILSVIATDEDGYSSTVTLPFTVTN